MKSTRDKILFTMLNNPRSTITDLAEAVSINAISVRHHLNSLLADGLVTSEEERHGVGRPRLVYLLTSAGLEKFPSRYYRLTNRLLEQIKTTLPSETVEKIFVSMAAELSREPARHAEKMSMEERLNYLKTILSDEGFVIEWEKVNNQYQIHEISCPYFHVGQAHPEICAVDQNLISQVLGVPTQKISCILRGDQHCTFMFPTQLTQGDSHE